MFAIAFDLVVRDTAEHHPKGVPAAYADIGATLAEYGFRRVQGSLYVCENEEQREVIPHISPHPAPNVFQLPARLVEIVSECATLR